MLKTMMNWKQNKDQKAYTNMLSSVRPYSENLSAIIIATDCDFTGRLGHLELNIRRLRLRGVPGLI